MDEPSVKVSTHIISKRNNVTSVSFQKSLLGVASEIAMFEYLRQQGYDIALAQGDAYHVDFVLTIDGKKINVDVKTKIDGKYWNQSKFENDAIAATGDRVLYLCIRVVDNDDTRKIIYCGCCWSDELAPSTYKDAGSYVITSRLRVVI